MPQSRTTTGIFLVIVLAVIGYVLVTLPPQADRAVLPRRTKSARGLRTFMWRLWGSASLLLGGLVARDSAARVAEHAAESGRSRAAEFEPERDVGRRSRRRKSPTIWPPAANLPSAGRVTPELQAEIAAAVEELEAKRESQQLEIVAFGTISSGKSSLLNALAGRPVFRTNVVGGTTSTRSEIPWPAGDRVVLVDTPGLAEVRGEARAAESAAAAKNADLVLFVVDGPLKAYESELLEALAAMEKRIVVCLNKEDWYDAPQRDELLRQLAEQVAPAVSVADVVAVRSRPTKRRRVRVLSDGTRAGRGSAGGAGYRAACAADDVDRRSATAAICCWRICCCNRAAWWTKRKSACWRRSTSGRMKSSANTCGRPAGPRRSIRFRSWIWPAAARSR